jgi:hypothetical protein
MPYYVRIQWAKDAASGGVDLDWVEYVIDGVRDVRGLPRKGEPTGNDILTLEPGWIAAVEIQGNVEQGWDHMGWDFASGTLLWGCWNDDPEDWPLGPWGLVRRINPIALDYRLLVWDGTGTAPDDLDAAVADNRVAQSPLDGKWYMRNVDDQTVVPVTYHADVSTLTAMVTSGDLRAQAILDGRLGPLEPWATFPSFHRLNTIHGIWVDDTTPLSADPEDTAWRRHVLARSQPPHWWSQ